MAWGSNTQPRTVGFSPYRLKTQATAPDSASLSSFVKTFTLVGLGLWRSSRYPFVRKHTVRIQALE